MARRIGAAEEPRKPSDLSVEDREAYASIVDAFRRDPQAVDLTRVWTAAATRFHPSAYHPIVCYAFFVHKWTTHYKRSKLISVVEYGDMETFVGRVGSEVAVRAIEAYFGLDWVTSKTLDFLLNPALFERHIVPLLAARRGEQAEHPTTARVPSSKRY